MKNKWFTYLAVGAIALVVLFAALLTFDDSLDQEVSDWLAQVEANYDNDNDAYYYLLGIMANADEDPLTVGKDIVDVYRKAVLHHENIDKPLEIDIYPDDKKLPLPQGGRYCSQVSVSCFNSLRANISNLQEELRTHSTLFARYQEFLKLGSVQSILKPTLHEIIPEYRYLLTANKLHHFSVMLELSNNEQKAVTMLYQDIQQWRKLFATADNLLSKMIALSILVDNLDFLANLVNAGGIKHASQIAVISLEERSLRLPLLREMAMSYDVMQQLDGNPKLWNQNNELAVWFVNVTFKLNMSMNELFRAYKEGVALSEMSAGEFMQLVESDREQLEFRPRMNIRNIGGYILNSVSSPNYSIYIGRINDLDAKIALLNARLAANASEWQRALSEEDMSGLHALSPYDGSLPYLDKKNERICFNGPLEDARGIRCIPALAELN